jgi:uncharacterized protein (TIGR04255 family)
MDDQDQSRDWSFHISLHNRVKASYIWLEVATRPSSTHCGPQPPETKGCTLAEIQNPLSAPLPAEVPLPEAPLVRVIGQVRFPPVLSLEKREFIASFQEAIRATYPVLRPEQAQSIVLGPQGVAPGPKQIAWRFSDVDGGWRVSVTPEFVAIETTSYTSRHEFLQRLRFVLEAFAEHVEPALVQRLGVRYIDRVTGDALADISTLVRQEVLGIMATPLSEHARHSLTETVFALPDSNEQLLARWGLVPAGATVDPNAIEPIGEASWVLDVDMFSNEEHPFIPEEIVNTARRFSERLYSVFRWAVTDDFLRRYGGTP